MSICFPDYENCILQIPNSILKAIGCDCKEKSYVKLDKILSSNPKNIIFVILDGLGANIVDNLPQHNFFKKHKIGKLSTVFPPTTTAATVSYKTILPPASHGWLGWSMFFKQKNQFVDIFKNCDSITKQQYLGSIINEFCPITTYYEKASKYRTVYKLNPPYENYGDSKSFDFNSEKEFFNLLKMIANLPEQKIIVSYMEEPDYTMHDYGPSSIEAKNVIERLAKEFENVMCELEDTVLIISADHGQVDIEKIHYLNDYPKIMECLQRPVSLEARAVNFFVKKGKHKLFEKYFNNAFGGEYLLFTKQEVLDKQLFGKGKYPQEYLGDYLACATKNSIIQTIYKDAPMPHNFKGHHAGLTQNEMQVPVIVSVNSKNNN